MKKRNNSNTNAKRIITGIIAFLIIFVMLAGMIAPFVYGSENTSGSKISISGEIGFNKKYKLGANTPFKVHISNSGDNFKGKLQIKINTSSEPKKKRYEVYSTEVELPKGGSKIIEMEIPINILKNSHKAVLLDEKGKTVATTMLYCSGVAQEMIMGAVLTDTPESLNYLKQLELNSNYENNPINRKINDKLIFLDETTLPKTTTALRSFNLIIIDNYDTSRLSNEQREALKEWLMSGGVLVIGTGENFDKVFNGIGKEIVDVTYNGTVQVNDLSEIGGNYKLNNAKNEPITINKISVKDGESILTKNQEAFSTIYYNEVGSVIVHNFALGLEPFLSLEGKERFLTDYYKSQLDYKTSYMMNQDYYGNNWTYLTSNLPSLNDYSLVIVFVIIAVYAIFIGPILYFILKKKDIREKGFIVIPVLALIITTVIYFVTGGTIYKSPIVNTVSKVQLNQEKNTADVSSATGVYSPKNGDINVEFDKNLLISVSNFNNYYYGYSGYFGGLFSGGYRYYGMDMSNAPEKDIVEVIYGENTRLIYKDKSSWAGDQFRNNYTLDINDGLESDLKIEGDTLSGTITNKTGIDLEEVIIGVRSNLNTYGTLKNGESLNIDQKIKFDSQNSNMYSAFDKIYDIYNQNNKLPNEEKRNRMFKLNMLNNLALNSNSIKYSTGYGTTVISHGNQSTSSYTYNVDRAPMSVNLYAFNYDNLYEAKLTVSNKKPYEINTNLVLADIPLNLEKMDKFDLPYGFFGVKTITATSQFDNYNAETEIYLQNSADVEFTYNIPTDINVELFQFSWSVKGGSEIYNVKDEKWESLSLNDSYDKDVAKYFDEEGNLKVRITNHESGYLAVPQIRIKGSR